jgi:alpha-tubulin suppressor-like RCC1 family protein
MRFVPAIVAVGLALITAPPSAVRAQITGPGVYAWGNNSNGQLGIGNTSNSSTPVQITGLSGLNVTAVSNGANAGLHTLALTGNGAVYAWGDNDSGQLGTGNTASSSTPVQVTGLSGVSVTAVAAGQTSSLAATSSGAVYAWGYQVGGSQQYTPALVTGGGLSALNVAAVAAGGEFSLALTSTGAVCAWGDNSYGQLGNGNTTNWSTPVQVTGLLSGSQVTAIAAGEFHGLAVTSTGSVYGWGYNGYGGLGDGNENNSSTPVQVKGLSGARVTQVAGGAYFSLALTSTGAVYAWGDNRFGELGNGTTADSLTAILVPFPPNGSATVVAISAGGGCSFALESDGSLWAWGFNYYGQLGNGTVINSLTPIEVYTPTGGYGVDAFAEGGGNSFAIVTAVPEPGSLALLGAAAGGWALWRRRAGTRTARPETAHGGRTSAA